MLKQSRDQWPESQRNIGQLPNHLFLQDSNLKYLLFGSNISKAKLISVSQAIPFLSSHAHSMVTLDVKITIIMVFRLYKMYTVMPRIRAQALIKFLNL